MRKWQFSIRTVHGFLLGYAWTKAGKLSPSSRWVYLGFWVILILPRDELITEPIARGVAKRALTK